MYNDSPFHNCSALLHALTLLTVYAWDRANSFNIQSAQCAFPSACMLVNLTLA